MSLENMFWIFFPSCKTFDYIISPSTVNILKLLLLGDEVQMMVHYLSGISVCCILFIHLAHTFFFFFWTEELVIKYWLLRFYFGSKCKWNPNKCSSHSMQLNKMLSQSSRSHVLYCITISIKHTILLKICIQKNDSN